MRADANSESDLFWGIRGAGANFGIVTSFEFQLHPVGPEIVHGFLVYSADLAHRVVGRFLDQVADAPTAVGLQLTFRIASETSPFRPALAGLPVVQLEITHSGPTDEGLKYAQSLRDAGLLADTVAVRSYLDVQVLADSSRGWGHRFYMKNGFLDHLPVAMPTGEEVTIEGEHISPDHLKIIRPSGEVVLNEPEQAG